MEGSYNAIRTYLWSGILSPKDQNYEVLMRQYEPMINLVKVTNIPPEKVNIGDMTVNNRQVNAFGACFLPMWLQISRCGDSYGAHLDGNEGR